MFSCRRFFPPHLGLLAVAVLTSDAAGQDIRYAPEPVKNMTLLQDEYFPYWSFPELGPREIYGLGLPHRILEKVYHKNAEKIFAQFLGGRR